MCFMESCYYVVCFFFHQKNKCFHLVTLQEVCFIQLFHGFFQVKANTVALKKNKKNQTTAKLYCQISYIFCC